MSTLDHVECASFPKVFHLRIEWQCEMRVGWRETNTDTLAVKSVNGEATDVVHAQHAEFDKASLPADDATGYTFRRHAANQWCWTLVQNLWIQTCVLRSTSVAAASCSPATPFPLINTIISEGTSAQREENGINVPNPLK